MKKWMIILGAVLLVLISTVIYLSTFSLKTITVKGCKMASEESVKKHIESECWMKNTIAIQFQNKISPIKGIPFVAKMDMEVKDKNTIEVTVYEKSAAGCIRYMENYIYFDRDGYVLETLPERAEDVPYIKGLTIKNWTLGEKLPLKNRKRFNLILDITQLIEKYKLDVDGIEFTAEGEIILQHGDIDIQLGDGSHLSIQLMNLNNILATVEGQSGVLYMKDYDSDTDSPTFSPR